MKPLKRLLFLLFVLVLFVLMTIEFIGRMIVSLPVWIFTGKKDECEELYVFNYFSNSKIVEKLFGDL